MRKDNSQKPIDGTTLFSMDDFDRLPKAKRQLLANAPIALALKQRQSTVEKLEQVISRHMHRYTIRDYGPDHPEIARDYYPKTVHGIKLEKLSISL